MKRIVRLSTISAPVANKAREAIICVKKKYDAVKKTRDTITIRAIG